MSVEAATTAGAAAAALVADVAQLNAHPVDAIGARPITHNQNTGWAAPGMVDGAYVHPTLPAGFDLQTSPPAAPGAGTVLSYGFMDHLAEYGNFDIILVDL